MRMGKTSEAITVCELWGSKKVAVIGTKNVRLSWRREFKRLGFKDTDFVMVNRLADLDKTGKYFLMTYDWIKDMWDPTAGSAGRLRELPPSRPNGTCAGRSRGIEPSQSRSYETNPCPHCQEPMSRPVLQRDPTGKHVNTDVDDQQGVHLPQPQVHWTLGPPSNHASVTVRRGPITGNTVMHHRPGSYVDFGLAAHRPALGDHIKGRQCQECGETDGTWQPPRYRRLKDRFTAVVADEVHNAKDYGTQNARAMYSFRSRRKIAMTGTLLSNSPLDAYWPLCWAIGGPQDAFPYRHVAGKKAFENRFCDFVYLEKPTGVVDEETGEEVMKTVRKRTPFLINPPDWWRMMQPKIKRRNYADPLFQSSLVEAGMKQPLISVKKVACAMHPKQVALMLDALRDFSKQYQAIKEAAESKNQEINPAMVISKMTALRKIATVPERLNTEFGHTGLQRSERRREDRSTSRISWTRPCLTARRCSS